MPDLIAVEDSEETAMCCGIRVYGAIWSAKLRTMRKERCSSVRESNVDNDYIRCRYKEAQNNNY